MGNCLNRTTAYTLLICLIFTLVACAKVPEPTLSSSGSSSEQTGQEERQTAEEYFAAPIEFEEKSTSYEYFYYPENASDSDPVVFEVESRDEKGYINGIVPNPYGLAIDGDKLEIIDGDKTRVIYEGDIKSSLMTFSQRKEKGYSDIRLINDVLVFPAVIDDGYEIRYAYIYDGESRLVAKSKSFPYDIYAVSNHEFVWRTTNDEYDKVYQELKENHPKEKDYIFNPDDENYNNYLFEDEYQIYPFICFYTNIVSEKTISINAGFGSEAVILMPLSTHWWLDYLPKE